jgi:hypothetical protein
MSRTKLIEHYRSILDHLYVTVAVKEASQQIVAGSGCGACGGGVTTSEDFVRIGGNSIGLHIRLLIRSFLSLSLSFSFFSSSLFSPLLFVPTFLSVAMQIVNTLRDQHIPITYEQIMSPSFSLRTLNSSSVTVSDENRESDGENPELEELKELEEIAKHFPNRVIREKDERKYGPYQERGCLTVYSQMRPAHWRHGIPRIGNTPRSRDLLRIFPSVLSCSTIWMPFRFIGSRG